jgi:hypothetical protein
MVRGSGHQVRHLIRPSLPAPGDRNHTHEVFYSSFRENPLALLILFGFRLSLSLSLSLVVFVPICTNCLSFGRNPISLDCALDPVERAQNSTAIFKFFVLLFICLLSFKKIIFDFVDRDIFSVRSPLFHLIYYSP